MTLEELRELARGIQPIQSQGAGPAHPELAAYNEAVARFRELLVLVRNRLILGGEGREPAGAAALRDLAAELAHRWPAPQTWLTRPPELEAEPSAARSLRAAPPSA